MAGLFAQTQLWSTALGHSIIVLTQVISKFQQVSISTSSTSSDKKRVAKEQDRTTLELFYGKKKKY